MTGFWQHKTLAQMTRAEWESLCDGCGRCCLHKLEDEDTGELAFTRVACHQLDLSRCRCRVYGERQQRVADCLVLSPESPYLEWLPATCAYRLVSEGKPLPEWHPLISGDPDSVHRAGISVRGWAVSEEHVDPDELETHIVTWLE